MHVEIENKDIMKDSFSDFCRKDTIYMYCLTSTYIYDNLSTYEKDFLIACVRSILFNVRSKRKYFSSWIPINMQTRPNFTTILSSKPLRPYEVCTLQSFPLSVSNGKDICQHANIWVLKYTYFCMRKWKDTANVKRFSKIYTRSVSFRFPM